MEERSRAAARPHGPAAFSRARLAVGLLLVAALAGGLAFTFSKLRGSPDAGRLFYAARQGVFVRELSSGDDSKVADLPDDVQVAMPSPDGTWIAYAFGQGELWLASLDGDREFQVADGQVLPLGWSPDGRLVAGEVLSDRDLVAVDPDGGRDVLMSGGYAAGAQPVWIDVDRFAIPTDDEHFVIVEAQEATDPIDGRPLAASPDGAELLVVRDDDVIVAKVDDDGLDTERTIFSEGASFAATSADGFVAVANDEGVYVFEGGTRSRRVVDRPVDWVGWGRGGAVLLYAYDGAGYALELRADGTGADPKRVTRRGADVFPLLPFAVAG